MPVTDLWPCAYCGQQVPDGYHSEFDCEAKSYALAFEDSDYWEDDDADE